MDPARRYAYRMLLYYAMLDLRLTRNPMQENPQAPGDATEALHRRLKYSASVADWLHNLAQSSASDFEGFNEDWFWQDYNRLAKDFADQLPSSYSNRFDTFLTMYKPGRPPTIG